jgi:hypothetical protein
MACFLAVYTKLSNSSWIEIADCSRESLGYFADKFLIFSKIYATSFSSIFNILLSIGGSTDLTNSMALNNNSKL